MWNKFVDTIRRYPVVSFYGLTYLFSWGFFVLAYIVFQNSLFLAWIGLFGPAIAGLVVTGICEGKTGLERLLAGLLHWRVRLGGYLFVILIPILLVFGTIFLHDGIVELLNAIGLLLKVLPILIGMTLLLIIPIAGEEIGWRGFALPRLQASYGPIKASLIIGVLWGIWHIPAALDPSYVLNRAPLVLSALIFIVSTTSFSFLYTWLWNYSGQSLLLMCLFHSFYNNVNNIFSVPYPYLIDQHWYYLAVLFTVLIFIGLSTGRKHWQKAHALKRDRRYNV